MTEPETSDCWDTSISLGMPLQNRISGRSPPWNKPLHVLDTGRRTQSCSLCWWAQWCRRICVPGPWISHHADSPSSHLSRPWMENQRMEPWQQWPHDSTQWRQQEYRGACRGHVQKPEDLWPMKLTGLTWSYNGHKPKTPFQHGHESRLGKSNH